MAVLERRQDKSSTRQIAYTGTIAPLSAYSEGQCTADLLTTHDNTRVWLVRALLDDAHKRRLSTVSSPGHSTLLWDSNLHTFCRAIDSRSEALVIFSGVYTHPSVDVIHQHTTASYSDDEPWFLTAHSTTKPLTLSQLGVIVDGITAHLQNGEYDNIDDGLRRASPSRMSVDAMVALGRLPALERAQLPSWKGYISRTCSELNRRGENPRIILSGLI